jgi:hypothetical protein
MGVKALAWLYNFTRAHLVYPDFVLLHLAVVGSIIGVLVTADVAIH